MHTKRSFDFDWNDWRAHMRNSIRTLNHLKQWIQVTPAEEEAIKKTAIKYRWSITPYYASLMHKTDENCPIRKQALPNIIELKPSNSSNIDPMGDIHYRKTNRVVHKYRDRIIFLVTETCAVYCRYCTRKYHTTDLEGTYFGEGEQKNYEEDFKYIENHPEIRDVLLTGGDPLVYAEPKLEFIIARLRKIKSIEIIRIGSRLPVLLPQRITSELCRMLEKYHPIWLNTHFNHPIEITKEAASACDRLLRHGIPVQNQSVLLKGINDNVSTLRQLFTELLKIRVRPYYLYHCDNVSGVSHFMTTIKKGKTIMEGLLGHLTGFAIPQYVIDTHMGKIPLTRNYIQEGENGFLESYEGKKLPITPVTIKEINYE